MNYKYIQKVSVLTVVIFILYLFVFVGASSASSATITGDVNVLWSKTVSSGNINNAVLISDVDGDNKDDALITNFSNGTSKVTAVRGYDGAELWSKSDSNWIQIVAAEDIDGDNKGDAFITNYTCSGNCTYTVTAVRGYDGAELWSKSYSNWIQVTSAGDIDGDNKDDALIKYWTGTYTVTAVRGYDGAELWSKSYSNWIEVTSAGDIDGDNKDDAFITNYTCSGTCTYTVTAVRGYDGAEFWSKSISGSSVWMQAGGAGDIDGDNKDDAFITNYSYNSGTETYTVTAVRGYDGADLWSKSVSGSSVSMQVNSAGDIDGDNKDDALITNQTYNSGTLTYIYTVTVVRGYDGAELWSKSISGSSVWISGTEAGDLNNDLKSEILIYLANWSSYEYSISALKGSDGSEFFRVEANDWLAGLNSTIAKKYDLNGDGGDDILVWTIDNIYALSMSSLQGTSVGYSATVASGQNTFVQSSNGNFGLLLKGQTKTLNNSVLLNNTGDISAKVEARFNDSIGGVFGLISGANVLNATNFALGLPTALVPLNSSGADVLVTLAPPGVTALDARLGVPNEQAAGDYTGTVVLTFSNDV